MSKKATLNRREFLAASFWVGLSTLVGWPGASISPDESSSPNSFPSRLTQLLKHKESAKVIGLEYLQRMVHEADVHTLTDLIALSLANSDPEVRQVNTIQLRELIRRRLRQDFEEGRIIKLHGWIVSVTEARLCALAVLV